MVIILVLVGAGGMTGYGLGMQKGQKEAQNGTAGHPSLTNFWDAWDIVNDKFYGDLNSNAQMDGAISGMVAALGDRFTTYLAPTESTLFKSSIAGKFGGIGAELEVVNQQLTIIAPLSGTPAEAAGLKANDVISKIEGADTGKMSLNEAIDKIRGDKGTTVKLTIARPGADKPFDVTLTRDIIVVKSVTTDSIGADKSIAYIKVNQFGDDTTAAYKQAMTDAVASGKKGLVIDLRNDPGGLLSTAIDMIGMMIPAHPTGTDSHLVKRIAVREKYKDLHEDDQITTADPISDSLPTVVLINSGSASAAEIFAGAMHDYNRATLIGEKSFGKGSVQTLVDLPNGGSIKVTIAHWLTPLGSEIHGIGITPDTTVTLADGQKPTEDDAQVQKALDVLGTK